MKIDIFTHFMPERFAKALRRTATAGADVLDKSPWMIPNSALTDVEIRLRALERYPDVLQVLTLVLPPLDELVAPNDAVELARIANDEMAELVAKYPNRFVAAAACLPLSDMDSALEEIDRAVTKLRLRGVQIFSNINGEPLDNPKFRPLFEKMVDYDLPIWIHPWWTKLPHDAVLGWPFETTQAMMQLAAAGIFEDYPDIKFITHHCGGVLPFLDRRIWWMGFERKTFRRAPGERYVRDAFLHLSKFYADTAIHGSTPALMCGYGFFGADRLLFGTDMPLGGAGSGQGHTDETIRSIERMDISEQDKAKILEENAKRLLRLQL